jgi:hypothetical protein
MFARCMKILTLNHMRMIGCSAHSILCGVESRVQVKKDMDPISMMNVLVKLFLLICIHFARSAFRCTRVPRVK